MAAIAAVTPIRESLGSLTLLIYNLTAQATSDTYQLPAGFPVVGVWISSANPGTEVGYVASTGVVTIINTSGTAAEQLFVLARV